ncbi:olfactory receptor 13 [Pteropus medius]|uniref:olfactory receptor 13-like n=1 Tax=Pteropus vampyrus TaxID=132908 RepID=UPI00196AEBDF|nr:olfactory receptor 13-like [Pteropus giganteus]
MNYFFWEKHSSVSEFFLLGFSRDSKINIILFNIFPFLCLSTCRQGLIVTLIHLDSCLHTPMYFFLSVLSLLDMNYVTITAPQMLVHLVCQKKTISYIGCVMQMYIFLVLGISEGWLFSVMAYDRYVAICHPLRYKIIMSPWLCGAMVVFCGLWGVSCSLVYIVFTIRLPHCGPNEINHFFCEVPAVLKLACADTSLNDQVDCILGFILLLVPLSFIPTYYICISATILRIPFTQSQLKAFSTCTSHITVVTMFCEPTMSMYMKPGADASPERDEKLALFYNVFSAFLNPIIYSLRNKDVKRAFL